MKKYIFLIICVIAGAFILYRSEILKKLIKPELPQLSEKEISEKMPDEKIAEPSEIAKLYQEDVNKKEINEVAPSQPQEKPKPAPIKKRTAPPPSEEEEAEDLVLEETEKETPPTPTPEKIKEGAKELSIENLLEAPDMSAYATMSQTSCESIKETNIAKINKVSLGSEMTEQEVIVEFEPGSIIDYKLYQLRKTEENPFRLFIDIKESCLNNLSKTIEIPENELVAGVKTIQYRKTENTPYVSRIAIEFKRKPLYKTTTEANSLHIHLK